MKSSASVPLSAPFVARIDIVVRLSFFGSCTRGCALVATTAAAAAASQATQRGIGHESSRVDWRTNGHTDRTHNICTCSSRITCRHDAGRRHDWRPETSVGRETLAVRSRRPARSHPHRPTSTSTPSHRSDHSNAHHVDESRHQRTDAMTTQTLERDHIASHRIASHEALRAARRAAAVTRIAQRLEGRGGQGRGPHASKQQRHSIHRSLVGLSVGSPPLDAVAAAAAPSPSPSPSLLQPPVSLPHSLSPCTR